MLISGTLMAILSSLFFMADTLSRLVGSYTTRRIHFLTLSYNRNAMEVR